MANKEIISSLRGLIGKYNLTDEEWQTVEKTIKLLNNSDSDCISRKNTLEAMIKQLGIRSEDYLIPPEATLYKVVKNMPPVTPKPKIDVLDKIKAEIRKKMAFNSFNEGYVLYDDIIKILDEYRAESEVKK